MNNAGKHVVIVGTTASGKSEIAIDLALELSRDVVSLDSMQIYAGMEIGTGVVPENERRGVAHHMLSIIEPTQHYSAHHLQQDVYKILDDTDDVFVFAGGTGLYTHAIIDKFQFAPTDMNIRQQVIDTYELDEHNPNFEKVASAYSHLQSLDPIAAERIDPTNVRRIIRALEAIQITGEEFSNTGDGIQAFGKPHIDCVMVGLRYERDTLRDRISSRVQTMLDTGWIEEVEALAPQWEEMAMPARLAIGYEYIYEWIHNGKNTVGLIDVKEHIINRTAQFSRRQRKWFERDPRVQWIDCDNLTRQQINKAIEQIAEGK